MGRDSWMLLTSFCAWVSGDPVDFLCCLFLTHHKALCPGDLLTSSPASSAACCQMFFTGQFIVFSMLLHKCHWLQAVPAVRVTPIHLTELLVCFSLSEIPKLRVWVPSVVIEKSKWITRSSSQNYLLKTCFSVGTWGSLSSSVSYLSSVLEGGRIWVSFITFPHLIVS